MMQRDGDTLDFLGGGGAMGERIRAFDWANTALGPPATWPDGLRTGVRLMLSSRHPMFVWWGPQLIQLYNDAYVPSIGPERHQPALGQPGRECWAEIWDIIGPQIDHVMQGRGSTWNENHLVPITRNGHREDVYWTYSYNPLNDSHAPHSVGGVLVICLETTASVLAERRNVAERERLEQMFAQAPGFMAMLRGPEHRFQFTNAAYQRLIGYREVIGKTVAEALPGTEARRYVALLDEVYRTGVAYTATDARYALEAEANAPAIERYVDFVYQPIKDASGHVDGVFVEGADVTKRRQAELALQALNESLEERVSAALAEAKLLNDVVDATDIFIQVLAPDGHILAINHAAADECLRLFGARPNVGDDMFQFLAARDRNDSHLAAQWHRAVRGAQFTVTQEVGHPDYATACHELRFSALHDRDGRHVGAYAIGRDVTEARRNSERLAAAEAQVLQAQKIETLGQLTGGVAHDFNNILMVVSAGIELVAGDVPADRKRLLDGMRQAITRGAGLTRQLLTFSRRQPLHPQSVDIAAQVEDMRELLERSLRGDIRVEYDFTADLWPVEADPGELELTILNLAVNARDALPNGGTITICARNVAAATPGGLAGDHVHLAVTDTGIGMAAEVLARATEPYFTTKGIGKGSGLGLAQAYGFAKASGGALNIQSRPGHGTTVSVFLPRSSATPATEGGQPIPPNAAVPGTEGVALLVEDDDTVAALTGEMIRHLGYDTVRVDSAAAALAKLDELVAGDGVDLVLSDVMMPGVMDGIDLAREVAARYPRVPVVLTSGVIDAARAKLRTEPVTLLAKPFQMRDLAAAVNAATCGRRAAS
jgi:PAS domain S-box-containing protein